MNLIRTFFILLIANATHAQSVSTQDIHDLIHILAHPALQGRGTEQPGFYLAGEFLAYGLRNAGFRPLPNKTGYFDNFTFEQQIPSQEETHLRITQPVVREYEYGQSFLPLFFGSETGTVESSIAFVGYGITASEYGYDDYENVDVVGKIIVILRHEPNESGLDENLFSGTETTEHSYFVTKVRLAMENGAIGAIFVEDIANHIGQNGPIDFVSNNSGKNFDGGTVVPIRKHMLETPEEIPVFPIISTDIDTASEILGHSILELQNDIEANFTPASFVRDDVRISMRTRKRLITHQSRNVVAYLPGKKKDEWVFLGAHYDHIGKQDDGTYLGADDNASGTTGVLAIAKALGNYVKKEGALRSNIVIGFWGAEEWGLIGSYMFVEKNLIDINDIKAVLNLDMIGRNDPSFLLAVGARENENFQEASPDLYRILMEENENLDQPFEISLDSNSFLRTDTASFYFLSPEDNRVPTLFLHTGEHDDYHKTTDTVDKIDIQKMKRVSDLALRILIRIAETKDRPRFIE